MTRNVTIRGLAKDYRNLRVVHEISFEVGDGEFVVLLGPSGCGKTTTLRMIAGLEQPSLGFISIGDKTVFDAEKNIFVRPENRDVGMVFQSYAIWPHMTVFENVAFALRVRKKGRQEIAERVARVLDIVGLSELSGRSATQLSGGQMQRIALARALVYDPSILLFDEPLSNLDLKLREKLRVELKELQRRTGLTSIYVTHDQAEAVELGDRVIVMKDGHIMQMGPPTELYRNPKNRFVAEFISSANIFQATVEARTAADTVQVATENGRRLSVRNQTLDTGTKVDVVIHPEDCQLVVGQSDTGEAVSLLSRQFQGISTKYTVSWNGAPFDVTMMGTRELGAANEQLRLICPPDAVSLLPQTGEQG